MIKGGEGGSRTITGLHFEERIDLREAFGKLEGYHISDDELYFNKTLVARFYKKHDLYKRLLKNIEWQKIISKKWLPDETILIINKNVLYIIEVKFQEVGGSVDEKLQTCDFKKKLYSKLLTPLGIKVEYVYVLNDWFKHERYKDTIEYIRSVGCYYFFEDLPLNFLGLPEPTSNNL